MAVRLAPAWAAPKDHRPESVAAQAGAEAAQAFLTPEWILTVFRRRLRAAGAECGAVRAGLQRPGDAALSVPGPAACASDAIAQGELARERVPRLLRAAIAATGALVESKCPVAAAQQAATALPVSVLDPARAERPAKARADAEAGPDRRLVDPPERATGLLFRADRANVRGVAVF